MTISRAVVALILGMAILPGGAKAQETATAPDSSAIHTTLRAFYFNLAHRDWEAIASQVLPAKVVAHRPAPEAMVAAADGADCPTHPGDLARITTEGDWAEVSVARCQEGKRGEDEFRLIHFEQRWRIVYIDLFEERLSVTAER